MPERSAFFPILILALVSCSAQAGERLVESLESPERFAARWGKVALSSGGEGSFRWLRIKTRGDGEGTLVASQSAYAPPLDLKGRFLKLWVRVNDVTRLGGLELRAFSGSPSSDYLAFNIPLFSDPDFNVLREGDWSVLTLSLGSARSEGSPDPSRVTRLGWYVADSGSGAPLELDWGGLALVDAAPEGVVSITFDDGYDEHLGAARRMAKRGFAGTAYVIPQALGKDGYLTLAQARELRDRYGWDVAAHHETPFTVFTPAELEEVVLGVQRFLAGSGFASGGRHLAYPLGKQDPAGVRPVVRKHFTTARVAGGGAETLPPADPHLLRAFNVTHQTSPEEIHAAARRARVHGEWLILMFHYLVDEAESDLEYGWEDFDRALDELVAAEVRVLPLSQVWDELASREAAAVSAPAKVEP